LLRGRPAQSIFSARSPTAKQLGLDISALDDEQMLALMVEHPTLIRRPLLAEAGDLVVGFDRQAYEQRLGDS
jgi:arsenate reductase-like glutaredoxin family protein